MRIKIHRWELCARATPSHTAPAPLSEALAEEFNREPQQFILKRSALSAARFYQQTLGLPVRFIVRQIDRSS